CQSSGLKSFLLTTPLVSFSISTHRLTGTGRFFCDQLVIIEGWTSNLLAKLIALPKISQAFSIGDRKSTRLNSSHVSTSYAVFCSGLYRVLPSFPTRRSSDLCQSSGLKSFLLTTPLVSFSISTHRLTGTGRFFCDQLVIIEGWTSNLLAKLIALPKISQAFSI